MGESVPVPTGGDVGESAEAASPRIETSVLKSGDVSDADAEGFIENLVETNFRVEGNVPLAESRHRLRACMSNARERLSGMPILGKIVGGDHFTDMMNTVYPDYSKPEHLRGTKASLLRMVEAGSISGLKVEGRLAAIQGVKKLNGTLRGRPVFEFTKASTLEEFKGKGYNRTLKNSVMKQILDENPGAMFTAISRNSEHLARFQARGWHLFNLDDRDPSEEVQLTKGENANYWEHFKAQGYKVVFFDPTEQRK